MKSVREIFKIDGPGITSRAQKYIQDAVAENKARGIIMGLSGGIDSAVLATLSVRSLGKDKVCAYFLHDKNSEKDSEEKARMIAEWLGLGLKRESIEARMREREKKAPFFKAVSTLPTFALPAIMSLYYLVVGETPYVTILRQKEDGRSAFKRWLYEKMLKGIEDMFDGPCEERRIFLEEIAGRENLLLIGSGNKSEDMTGWFTVKGVDNMPVSPLKGLYKTQVRLLAEYLAIPEIIRKSAPSADVMRGADDALALGMSFDKIDIALYFIENKIPEHELKEYSLVKSELERIRDIHHLSDWRRGGESRD